MTANEMSEDDALFWWWFDLKAYWHVAQSALMPDLSCVFVVHLSSGQTPLEVCRALDIPLPTFGRWLHQGRLELDAYPGRPTWMAYFTLLVSAVRAEVVRLGRPLEADELESIGHACAKPRGATRTATRDH